MGYDMRHEHLPLQVQGVELSLACLHRPGDLAPVVFLHGFGSSKEDYADITRFSAFSDRRVIAYDAPGCGESRCNDLSRIDIPFLVETALTVLDHYGVDRFHLVGHSMGALTALMLARQCPERVLSFVNIKGNLAAEDCFLSRQIFDYPSDNDEQFFTDFIERTRLAPEYSCALYAASLRHKVRSGAVRSIFQSMVALSDSDTLLESFIRLPCPKMFMFGEQYANLSYLPQLKKQGVRLAEIPYCGHFPMYANPVLMWTEIADLQQSVASGG